MKNLKTLLNVRIGLGIFYFLISMILASMLNKEKQIAGANISIETDLSDTNTLDKYDVIKNLEKENGTETSGQLSLNYDGLVEEKVMSAEDVLENEKNLFLQNDVPKYERAISKYNGRDIVSQYEKEEPLQNQYQNQNEQEKTETKKKRGFNTINYGENNSGSASNSRGNNEQKYSCRVPYEQIVGIGNKVKVILKESIGTKNEGDFAIGVVSKANNSGSNSIVDIVFSGNQFGISYPLYLYFGNSRGVETESNQNNEIENEVRSEGGNMASDIVSEIPIIGSLGSRIIRTASMGNNRSNNIKIELVSGERLSLGQ